MRSLFPHRLYTQKLFCRRCRRVLPHGIFAKESYSTYGGLAAHIPLLCICDECETPFVAFSHEFSVGRNNVGTEYAKIYGYNRIAPGNWLYFKGETKPGVVKSYFQTQDKEVIVISYGGEPGKKIELEKQLVEQEIAPEGYRLIPAQTAHVLIGDHVYHAIRNQFGVAVGLVSDAGKDKLAVQLEDDSLLFITIPLSMQNIPNDQLSTSVRERLLQLFAEDAKRVAVTVGQGIVYLDGIVKNLATKRALCACVNSMHHVRGCVDFMRVQMETYISDERLEMSILRLLESPSVKIFDYKVSVKNSFAKVEFSCRDDLFPKDLENRILMLPGLQELEYLAHPVPQSFMENWNECEVMERELASNPRLAGAIIKVSFVNNKYLLEGCAQSSIQRQWAFISVMKMAKTPSIENRLRIN